MYTPDKLKKAFNKVEEENWTFRTFLKGTEPKDLDKLVNKLHHTLFKEIDCKECQNCCKSIVPTLTNKDISRISKVLGMTFEEFKNNYLKEDEDQWIINSNPCPFLTTGGCSIYDSRPRTCMEYPHTDKKEVVHRLYNIIGNCEICPVVFEIIERLKMVYKREFNKYNKDISYW